MRDCVFLVADSHMETVFKTFLGLPHRHEKLGTASFSFNAESDLVLAGNDPAVYRNGPSLIHGHQRTHRHAVLVLDFQFEHEKKPDEMIAELTSAMVSSGWDAARFQIVLIQPELEAWLWQDNPNIEKVFFRNLNPMEKAKAPSSLRQWLCDQRLWPTECVKPPDPKKAMQKAADTFRAGSQMAVFTEVFRNISVHGCQDEAFHTLRDALRRWFPRSGSTQ